MKKIGIVASVVALCLILAGCFNYVSAAEKSTKKGAKETASTAKGADTKVNGNSQNAAIVNGTAIPKSEFDAEVARFSRQLAMTGRNPDEKELASMREKILDNLIGRELLKQEAKKKKIVADKAEVDAQLEALKKKFGSPEEFQATLVKMNITEDALREQFASEVTLRKLIDQEVASKVTVSPTAAKEFYDKNPDVFKTPEMVRASHILVKVEKNATPEEKAKALEKIKGIQKKIKDGADFAQTAKEVSDCPSKENGGDLDFFQRGQMVAPFENAAFSLKPGQVSDIVETEFGYHLIKVTDRKDAGVMSFEEMKPKIEQHVKSEEVAKQLTKYVEQLRSKAKVEVLVH